MRGLGRECKGAFRNRWRQTINQSGDRIPTPSSAHDRRGRNVRRSVEFDPAIPARLLATVLGLGLGLAGCASLANLVDKPLEDAAYALGGDHDRRLSDPVALQGELLRFSDSFHSSILYAVNRLRHGSREIDPRKLLSVELHFSQNVLAAATGANPFANLLDLIVIVTLTRLSVQDHWLPEVFGESARPLLDACLEQEREAWRIATQVLTSRDRKEFRRAIGQWRQRNPDIRSLEELRVTGFVAEIARFAKTDDSSGESVFDMLHIDPLAALDPAAREIAQTRYFGERALFLIQRMPTLLRWQTELLTMDIADMPQMRRTLADADRLGEAATQLGLVVQQLPALIDGERRKVIADVQSSASRLTTLADKAQHALAAGDRMAKSADETLKTLREIQAAAAANPKPANASPFRVEDYTALAEQVAWTAAQINTTLKSLDNLVTGPDAVAERQSLGLLADDLERRGDRLIDRLIRAGILLIAAACAGLVAVLIAYRLALSRLTRSG